MVIRKLTLAEWFLRYQLKEQEKSGFFNPVIMKLDLGGRATAYRERYGKIPLNALVLQAIGRLARRRPEMQRLLFRTAFGLRFLEMSEVRVNFPIEIRHAGQSLTAAIVIANPDLKSVEEINAQIREAKNKDLSAYPINSFMARRGNYFWNRWALMGLYRLSMRSPKVYHKMGGGALSLSSLTHAGGGPLQLDMVARGNTALTFCLSPLEEHSGHAFLHLGVGMDHTAITGADMGRCLNDLGEELLKSFDTMLRPERIVLNLPEANA